MGMKVKESKEEQRRKSDKGGKKIRKVEEGRASWGEEKEKNKEAGNKEGRRRRNKIDRGKQI